MFGFGKKKVKSEPEKEVPIRDDLSIDELLQQCELDNAQFRPSMEMYQNLIRLLGSDMNVKRAEFNGSYFEGGTDIYKFFMILICRLHLRIEKLEKRGKRGR